MTTTLTIFGSYNRISIGDKAILISLIDLLFRQTTTSLIVNVLAFDPEDIEKELQDYFWASQIRVLSIVQKQPAKSQAQPVTYSKRFYRRLIPEQIRVLMDAFLFWRQVNQRDLVKDSAALIIGGGNLLMDLFSNWPIRPYLVALQFQNAGLPVIIAGVGAFPIRTILGEYLLKQLVNSAKLLYVRDQQTKNYIQQHWQTSVDVHPDFALSLPIINKTPSYSIPYIAVNIGSIYLQNEAKIDKTTSLKVINCLASELNFYYQKNPDKFSLYLYDTNYPTDRDNSILLQKNLIKQGVPKQQINYEDKCLTVASLIKRLQMSKLAIVTRLHAGLLALRVGLPILAIAYQPKVKTVLTDMGLSKGVIDLATLEEGLKEGFSEIDNHPEQFKLTPSVYKQLNQCNESVVNHILGCVIS